MKRSLFTRFRSFIEHPTTAVRAASLLLLAAPPAFAWNYRGAHWPDGDVVVVIHTSDENAPTIGSNLLDRTTTWAQVVRASIDDWNEHMDRITLVEGESSEAHLRGNGINEIFFAPTIYGEEFGENVLGVTLSSRGMVSFSIWDESDIVFNTNEIVWNSYRGNLRAFSIDFRRVVTHEMGHLLGLNHPDEADPVQEVEALMNSTISDLDALAEDDIAGIEALYSDDSALVEITKALEDLTVNVGDIVTLSFELNGAAPPADSESLNTYYWFYPAPITNELTIDEINALNLFTFSDPDLFIGAAQPYDAGTYTVWVDSLLGTLASEATLTVNPVTTSPDTKMANLSTRAYAGSGSQTLQVGFVIEGTGTKRVLVRAVGPTLGEAPFNLGSTHSNPRLTLIRSGGGTIATNDDWGTNDTASAAEIASVTQSVGGFALPDGSLDAALLVDLEPGVYTALVEGDAGSDGLVIVEAYDADSGTGTSKLVNLSTRGYVGSGNNIMIAGLVVDGPGPRTYLVRAIGDTLVDFGINDTVADTYLTIYRGSEVIRVKDDWDDPVAHQPMLIEAMNKVGAFNIPHDTSEGGKNYRQESITLLTLYPGAYTLQVSDLAYTYDEEAAGGVAIIEIYDYPDD